MENSGISLYNLTERLAKDMQFYETQEEKRELLVHRMVRDKELIVETLMQNIDNPLLKDIFYQIERCDI